MWHTILTLFIIAPERITIHKEFSVLTVLLILYQAIMCIFICMTMINCVQLGDIQDTLYTYYLYP